MGASLSLLSLVLMLEANCLLMGFAATKHALAQWQCHTLPRGGSKLNAHRFLTFILRLSYVIFFDVNIET